MLRLIFGVIPVRWTLCIFLRLILFDHEQGCVSEMCPLDTPDGIYGVTILLTTYGVNMDRYNEAQRQDVDWFRSRV